MGDSALTIHRPQDLPHDVLELQELSWERHIRSQIPRESYAGIVANLINTPRASNLLSEITEYQRECCDLTRTQVLKALSRSIERQDLPKVKLFTGLLVFLVA